MGGETHGGGAAGGPGVTAGRRVQALLSAPQDARLGGVVSTGVGETDELCGTGHTVCVSVLSGFLSTRRGTGHCWIVGRLLREPVQAGTMRCRCGSGPSRAQIAWDMSERLARAIKNLPGPQNCREGRVPTAAPAADLLAGRWRLQRPPEGPATQCPCGGHWGPPPRSSMAAKTSSAWPGRLLDGAGCDLQDAGCCEPLGSTERPAAELPPLPPPGAVTPRSRAGVTPLLLAVGHSR